MTQKIQLDAAKIKDSRRLAKSIADQLEGFLHAHSTVTVERTICRLLGIDGVSKEEVPLPNIVVEHIDKKGGLTLGAAYFIGNAMIALSLTPQEIAEKIASDATFDLTKLDTADMFEISLIIHDLATQTAEKIKLNRKKREDFLHAYGDKEGPLLYAIVATGNIFEDIDQAKAAARQGVDVVAVIRTTGQSLLDYVPYGATTEGFGGTYATQENFKLMRKALDEVGTEEKRYIRLTNYCSGLCMPEIAAMGALERLDMMLNDALYGILFRDINMKRTMVDQYFSRMINAYAGVIINTGEDNYLTTADALEEAHTVLASQFINEQFALKSGLKEEQMGLGHAFEIDPGAENSFLYEVAQAQMSRQIFPKAPLKYMPPTKFKTGNIFKAHVQDALFNAVTIMTGQKIHLLGMLTEAIHTPFMQDRFLSIENAKYLFNAMKDIESEIEFKSGGFIENRANETVDNAHKLLGDLEEIGLFQAIERGIFGDVKRSENGGKGLEGVFVKDEKYFNPFIEIFMKEV